MGTVLISALIDTDDALKELCDYLLVQPMVAVDTEFVWTRTYFPQLGIIQLGLSPDEVFIVDVLAIDSVAPLRDLMESKNVCKVFHDAFQDVSIINLYINACCCNVFDTQLAAAFTGFGAALSLEKLVLQCMDIQLTKTETRTDWLQRPLDPAQIEYAFDDVRYLLSCAESLIQLAEEKGTLPWLLDECQSLSNVSPFAFDESVERQYRRLQGKVHPRSYVGLYRLLRWIEEESRSRDIPREHILRRELFPSLLYSPFDSLEDLKAAKIMSSKTASRYGATLLNILADETVQPPESLLKSLKRKSDSDTTIELITQFTEQFQALADQYTIEASRIYNRKNLADIIRSVVRNREIPVFSGWRQEFLKPLMEELFKIQMIQENTKKENV